MITPQEQQRELAKELGLPSVFFKREDLHPYKSHKGRSIPLMIKNHVQSGKRKFALSSSGNAAIAAALYANEHNASSNDKIELEIFVGQNINPEKLKVIEAQKSPEITITQTARPLQSLFARTQNGEVTSLRQSHDDTALSGYASLAEELAAISDLEAVFIPTSSGTTAQALGEWFKGNNRDVAIHVVQTISCHPMTDAFTSVMQTDEQSKADAIVDHVALRKTKVEKVVNDSAGTGWIIGNDEIDAAVALVKKTSGLDISPNSALSVAALMQASYTGEHFDGSVVCLITGK